MQEREIIKIVKDHEGNIIALRNQYMGWSPVSVNEVIQHIESDLYSYYVKIPDLGKVSLCVEQINQKKILRTDPSKAAKNLLGDLPIYVIYDD